MSLDPALPGWQAVQCLQHLINTRNLISDALACEEALSDLLNGFSSDFPPNAADVNRRFRSLRRNRLRKQRRRRALLVSRGDSTPDVPPQRLDQQDNLRYFQAITTADDWRLIESVASMTNYATLASEMGVSVGQLRTRVSRLRARLKATAIENKLYEVN